MTRSAQDAALMAELIDNSPDPVFSVRPSGRLTFANAACRAMLGIDLDQVGHVNVFEIMPASAVAAIRPTAMIRTDEDEPVLFGRRRSFGNGRR